MIAKTPIYNFIEFSANEKLSTETIQQLLNEEVTGILFKGFLAPSEVQSVKKHLQQIPTEKKTIVNQGFHSYPMSFAQFTQMKAAGQFSIEDYINTASKVLANQLSEIGIDVTKKLINFLEQMEPFRHVSPIIEPQYGKPLVPFNVRELFPGNGELVVHCENLFFDEFPDFFNWLRLMNIKENKFSYFITIQKPESGGELCCYNLNWKKVKARVSHTKLLDVEGKTIDIEDENTERYLVLPEEGDLLLFAGGNVWHKVLTVQGKQSRITIGGFVAETNTPGTYYIWS